ncbi:MAG: fused response regulator/phosphatase [Spirochaetales bacterium]|nr:fused response regulator/phosphatase [Spirochaetales bacterium]
MKELSILLVDDEGPVVRALKRELSQLAENLHCILRTFQNPEKALDFIKEYPNDVAVVVSDQRMPEMKGSDLITRAKEINNQIQAILLTAYTDIEDIIKTVRAGLSSFVLKPWNEEDLLAELKRACEEYRQTREASTKLNLFKTEFNNGGEMQKNFLQTQLPRDERIKCSVEYQPVLSCGGDYYDIIKMDKDNYLAVIGDVAGHGMTAAFVTFILKTLFNDSVFKYYIYETRSLSRVLSWINMRLYQELKQIQPLIVSLCLCRIDLKNKKLSIVNAGHMFPYILRKDQLIQMDVTGTALGVYSDLDYSEYNFPLQTKDKILLYTDGLTETEGGIKAFKDLILFYRDNPYFSSVILEELRKRDSPDSLPDDKTLLTLELLK